MMRSRRLWRGLIIAAGALMLTGCADSRPINQRTLVLAMGFDPSSNPQSFTVVFQAPTPSAATNSTQGASSATGQSEVFSVSGQGRSLEQAFTQAQAQVSKDLYLGQLQLVVISDRLPASLLKRALNDLRSLGYLDKTPYVVTTPRSAASLLNQTTPQAKFPSLYFLSLFGCVPCQTDALGVRWWQFLVRLDTPGIDPYAPSATAFKQGYQVNQVALYRHYRYVTTLSPEQTITFGLMKGLAHKASIFLPSWHATMAFLNGPSRLTTRVVQNHIYAHWTIRLHATLEGVPPSSDNSRQLQEMSARTAAIIARRATTLIALTQKEDVDPFGVGRMLSWQHPEAFRKFLPWHKTYPHVETTVDCVVQITNVGTAK